jgi:hypothetical protein
MVEITALLDETLAAVRRIAEESARNREKGSQTSTVATEVVVMHLRHDPG